RAGSSADPVAGRARRPARGAHGQPRPGRSRPAVLPVGARSAVAAAVDGRRGLRLGLDPFPAVRNAVRQPAGGQDGRLHGHLQFLHRDPAAGRRQPAGLPAARAVRRPAAVGAGPGWRQPGGGRGLRAGGAAHRGGARMNRFLRKTLLGTALAIAAAPAFAQSIYGTREPFASEAVYFVMTDRFVNGDPANDHRDQGGEHHTFDRPLEPCDGVVGNVGYLGGDFRGLLDNAGYIADMGFTAVWITPIVDNPDQAFTGGDPITCDGFLTDQGKTGFHGYWGVNFYRLDEHLPSADLDFAGLTAGLRGHGLKTVLDIVANHGSPAWTMPVAQPQFGQIIDAARRLVADHQNLEPEQLDPAGNPLHAFYNARRDLAQLSDLAADNPAVMDYLVGAYLKWIGQGVDALRIDTIRHQPLPFWKAFTDRIRAEYPGMFMFGESFDYEAAGIAEFTKPENGGVSVLDFPMKKAMDEVFSRQAIGGFERLAQALYLEDGP